MRALISRSGCGQKVHRADVGLTMIEKGEVDAPQPRALASTSAIYRRRQSERGR
jgi:hypothetical protein